MKTIKVWDPFVRIFHWALVAGVVIQLVTAEEVLAAHAIGGYCILTLVAARLVWGVIGTRHARFTDFIYPPSEIVAYLKGLLNRNPRHYIGHNPAGGAMVCVLLCVILLVAMTGLKTLGKMGRGPLANQSVGVNMAIASEDHDDEDEDDEHGHGSGAHFWKEIHETFVGLLIGLVVIHIGGVIASSLVHKENLIRAMVTGKKEVREPIN